MDSRTKEKSITVICISLSSRGFDRVWTLFPKFVPVRNKSSRESTYTDAYCLNVPRIVKSDV